MSETAVLTTSEVADELGTDPKTLRKFFRSEACESITPVGQGKRYAITQEDIEELGNAFTAWSSGKAKKAEAADDEPKADKAAPKAKKAKKSKRAVPVADDEEDFLDKDDDGEPTADMLAELDDLGLDDEDLDI